MSTVSPGPWRHEYDYATDTGSTSSIVGPDGQLIIEEMGPEAMAGDPDVLAAAWDMLDALRAIHFFVVEDITDEDGGLIEDREDVCITPQYFDAIMKVRAAIAKATGGAR